MKYRSRIENDQYMPAKIRGNSLVHERYPNTLIKDIQRNKGNE